MAGGVEAVNRREISHSALFTGTRTVLGITRAGLAPSVYSSAVVAYCPATLHREVKRVKITVATPPEERE
jgi:hypothetical protein